MEMISDYGLVGFYRLEILINGSLYLQLGLEHFRITGRNKFFPGQIHPMSDASKDVLGYYILFEETSIKGVILSKHLRYHFSFLNHKNNGALNAITQR